MAAHAGDVGRLGAPVQPEELGAPFQPEEGASGGGGRSEAAVRSRTCTASPRHSGGEGRLEREDGGCSFAGVGVIRIGRRVTTSGLMGYLRNRLEG